MKRQGSGRDMPEPSKSKLSQRELERTVYETAYELGLDGVTLEKVSERAGISKGVTHHYFPNKEDLYLALVRQANRHYFDMVRWRMKSARSASHRLWCVIESHLSPGFFEPQFVRAYLPLLVGGVHDPRILRVYDAINARGRASVKAILRTWLEPEDAVAASYTIWSLLEGAWILPASQTHLTRSLILRIIADYLRRIPAFDQSVINFQEMSQSSVPREGKVAIRTIRRAELEKAALLTIYEIGFRDMTVQHVAEKAQLSKGVVHHYFLSKDDLVAGAIRHEFREFGHSVARLLEKTSNPSERLWIIINSQLADQYLHFSYLRWYLNSIEAGFRNKGISQVYDIAERRGRSNIAAALKELMPAAEARKTTLVLWSMIEGSCYMMFSDQTITRKQVLLEIARYLISNIPAFDSSVVIIEGARANGKRAGAVQSIEREKIYKATHEVIEHVGYRKFTFELLAEHMGIPPEAIQRHYRGSYDLIAATARFYVTKIEEISEYRSKQAKSASEALWALVYSDVEPAIMTRRVSEVYLSFLEAGLREPQILEIYEYEEGMRRSAIASELRTLMDVRGVEMVLANLTTMLQGAWRLLPCDPEISQSDVLKSISEYLTRSVPGFDSAVLELSVQWSAESGAPAHQ
jgi:TetR/AcrR family transcriptional repressor of bet genes